MKTLFSLLLLAVLCLSACRKDSNNTQALIPIDVGNEWVYYRTTIYPDLGTRQVDTIKHSFTGSTTTNQQNYTVFSSDEEDAFFGATAMRKDAGAYYLLPSTGSEVLFLYDNAAVGTTWFSNHQEEVLAIGQTLATPVQSFNNVTTIQRRHIEGVGVGGKTSIATHLDFQPSIGLVHLEKVWNPVSSTGVGTNKKVILELIQYTVDGVTQTATNWVGGGAYSPPVVASDTGGSFGPFGLGSSWTFENKRYDSTNVLLDSNRAVINYASSYATRSQEFFKAPYGVDMHVKNNIYYQSYFGENLKMLVENPTTGMIWRDTLKGDVYGFYPYRYTYEVVATGQTLVLGNLTFNNVVEIELEVRGYINARDERYYYQKGIGLLKKTSKMQLSGELKTSELLTYSIL